jgi:hypothetical protein
MVYYDLLTSRSPGQIYASYARDFVKFIYGAEERNFSFFGVER